ncbi:MAG: hypothetical protein AAGI44_00760 [Pseudomonadota bacterium]
MLTGLCRLIDQKPRLMLLLLTIAAAGCDSSPADQQNSSDSSMQETGYIEGTIGDSQGQWLTLRRTFEGSASSTGNFSSPMGTMTSYTLQGHEAKQFQIENSVSISFTNMNGELIESGVNYFHSDDTWPFYGDNDGSVTIEISELEVSDDVAQVVGRVTGRIYLMEGLTAEPDLSDYRDIDLRFNVTAYRE